jgi:hypothetical protein
MSADDMKARTPAPEGEVSLWGCADGNGIDPRLVFRDRPTAEQVAADMNMVAQPLYASPVVLVKVSREEIVETIEEHVFADDSTEFTGVLQGIPEAADAIFAALRPTDTGREA